MRRYQILVVDSVGLLSSLYRYGTLAYIGGGFGVGIHNVLEAATFGLPVIFGPNYKKFQEAVDLINRGGAFSIQNYGELENILLKMFENSEQRLASGSVSRKYVNKNRGSTEQVIQKVFN
jgi:3-deoxy-D-manno-octulosonic-acid transferase